MRSLSISTGPGHETSVRISIRREAKGSATILTTLSTRSRRFTIATWRLISPRGEIQQLSGDPVEPVCLLYDAADVALYRLLVGWMKQDHLGAAAEDGQRVADIVEDKRRESSEYGEPFRLQELLLGALQLAVGLHKLPVPCAKAFNEVLI